ncbi:MAG: zf-HC2 domain-containing protein [Deltaproteobacteria bacterium]|nr:zf-HC2 domain-containing protein [Deltaproteobacteria bacterium]
MTCREFTEFLMAYLDGELASDVRSAFESHMFGCQTCVNYLESYQATIQLGRVACAEDEPVPSDVPESLVQAILAARKLQ